MMIPKDKKSFEWDCSGDDPHHGCWSADWDGRCTAHRSGYPTKEEAMKAGERHLRNCRFSNATITVSIYKPPRKPRMTAKRRAARVDFLRKRLKSLSKSIDKTQVELATLQSSDEENK